MVNLVKFVHSTLKMYHILYEHFANYPNVSLKELRSIKVL